MTQQLTESQLRQNAHKPYDFQLKETNYKECTLNSILTTKGVREYSGRSLRLMLFTGKVKTVAQRTILLKQMYTLHKEVLDAGTYKVVVEPVVIVTAEQTLDKALTQNKNSN